MKKKLLALVLSAAMVLSLTGCGSKAGFTEDELVFKGSEDLKVALDHYILTTATESGDRTLYQHLYADEYEIYEEAFSTSRGLEIGMTFDDYKKLYNIKYGYAVWELIEFSDNPEMGDNTYLAYYINQDLNNMYYEYEYYGTVVEMDQVWLDLGWYKEGGSWKVMTDEELMNVWFCDADLSDFDEVVILSVFLDEDGEVGSMYLYHITYDEDWVMWQDWG